MAVMVCLLGYGVSLPLRDAGHSTAASQPVVSLAEGIVPSLKDSQENLFEQAVEIIKKYETLHTPKHWPLIGYGHKVLPGEKFSRNRTLSEKEADALLRKDLLKNCAVFREFGADSLLLGVLAYNIGSGATLRSSVVKKLKAGDRDIRQNYLAHSRYRGKVHSQIQKRRIEEFDALYVDESLKKLGGEGTLLSSTQLSFASTGTRRRITRE